MCVDHSVFHPNNENTTQYQRTSGDTERRYPTNNWVYVWAWRGMSGGSLPCVGVETNEHTSRQLENLEVAPFPDYTTPPTHQIFTVERSSLRIYSSSLSCRSLYGVLERTPHNYKNNLGSRINHSSNIREHDGPVFAANTLFGGTRTRPRRLDAGSALKPPCVYHPLNRYIQSSL